MRITLLIRFCITALVISVAATLAFLLWRQYMYEPWTRDAKVKADVITVAPDVAGLVLEVPVKDNGRVKKDDVLLVIDPSRYRLALAQADALTEARREDAKRLREEADRRAAVGSDVVSREGHERASFAALVAEAELRKAEADRDLARLNLDRTRVISPVDGFVTNLTVFPGDYATVGVPRMAVIDEHSFWICGYFEETKLPGIHAGDRVEVTPLAGTPSFIGTIEGIAKGIGESDNPTGPQLLVNSTPVYNWVRLAQRIPVRIGIPASESARLSMGMTCTVVVREER